MKAKATVDITGELLEFPMNTPTEIIESWRICSEYKKAYDHIQDQLKKVVPDLIGPDGTYRENDYQFRQVAIQRKNYDKYILRQNLDEDIVDLFLEPNKTKVDAYIKENLNDLGEVSTILRSTMVNVGQPYSTIRLEKVK